MGCAQSKPRVLPPTPVIVENGGEAAVPPHNMAASKKGRKKSAVRATSGAGTHWAEGSPNQREPRRIAQNPWSPSEQQTATVAATVSSGQAELPPCQPCNDAKKFDFRCTFPVYVMKVQTFLEMEKMRTHEEMISEGLVFEWTPQMGRLWFLSHQWASFKHPDPESEQLRCAQQVLKTIGSGGLRSLFVTDEEWQGFHWKEANRFINASPCTPEEMAAEAQEGFVWLDYSSVPQALDAEEARLRAIDSIPFYVDNATTFVVLTPRVQHKDLPDTHCDYKSWTERGWCRLETQVHELRLFHDDPRDIEIMPGLKAVDIPRRPLVVHSPTYCTTYDMFDNFYMVWQRKNSIFNGQFACCRLGHKRVGNDGEEIVVQCDKERIRPLCEGLWDRKIEHLRAMHPILSMIFLWRWASHRQLMLCHDPDDSGEADDPSLQTLEDVVRKYSLDGPYEETLKGFLGMMDGMFSAHKSFHPPSPEHEDYLAAFRAWVQRWKDAVEDGSALRQVAIMLVAAEGHLPMMQALHADGARLDMGFFWGITFVDFAAGKGHLRLLRWMLERPEGKAVLNKRSFRDRISAVDRACKAGYVDALDLLHEHGADIECRRLNLMVPAHGAAIWGHVNVLQRLHDLGADVLTVVDDKGFAPLDYALYFRQTGCAQFLRALGGDGFQTALERGELSSEVALVMASKNKEVSFADMRRNSYISGGV